MVRQLLFKRLKSILAMGHLPKYDDQSSRAWLHGKLPGGAADAEVGAPRFRYSPLGLRYLADREYAVPGVSSNSLCTNFSKASPPRLDLEQVLTHWNEIALAVGRAQPEACSPAGPLLLILAHMGRCPHHRL